MVYKNRQEAIEQYSAGFSRAIHSVLRLIESRGTLGSNEYLGALRDALNSEFPSARKNLDHIAHWIIYADGILNHRGIIEMSIKQNPDDEGAFAIQKNGCTEEQTEEIIRMGVEKYIDAITSRARERRRH